MVGWVRRAEGKKERKANGGWSLLIISVHGPTDAYYVVLPDSK